jgi:hypothetical protein
MNRVLTFAALSMALLAVGCGGSSTGTNTSPSTGATYSSIVIEADLLSSGAQPPVGTLPVVEDTLNLQLGELVKFVIVGYDSVGGRHELTSTDWRNADTSQEFGSLDPGSGQYAIGQNAMGSSMLVEGKYQGVPYRTYFKVNPTQARLIGQVVSSDGRTGVRGVSLQFFAQGGEVVGSVKTSYDGTFRASVPLNAVSFTIDPASVSTPFWQSFNFGLDSTNTPVIYDAGSPTCTTPFNPFYSRAGVLIGTTLSVGENFMFQPQEPSGLLTPVVPAVTNDPSVIVLAARTTYAGKPVSTGCSG